MNRTRIEWCDYTINPIKGLCKYACSYCYARRMYKRFKWDPTVRLDLSDFDDMVAMKPSKIFVCSTHDIMGRWISDSWINDIIHNCFVNPQHTFIFLTKNPKRYSEFEFPKNCWLGKTDDGINCPPAIINNNTAFISFEPLLKEPCIYSIGDYDWIIVGGLTPNPIHKKEWVEDILKEARRKNVPVFLKNNLHWHKKIQESPE